MTQLALAAVAFNKPRLVAEQIRLLRKYLDEDFGYTVVDASSFDVMADEIRQICETQGVGYLRSPSNDHGESLNVAWRHIWDTGAPYLGLLDHDVFPVAKTRLIPRIDDAGFLGLGQRHAPTGRLYIWPGWAFLRREFVGDKLVDWRGIRGDEKKHDGDTGSGLWPLFENPDVWKTLWRGGHSYKAIRPPDDFGSQSWAVEVLAEGDWLHFANASGWMQIPEPQERERLCMELLEAL